MDFLMLFSDRKHVVIEVDGKQHYAVVDVASPRSGR
jgi:very-short-patch-repair endonuclease